MAGELPQVPVTPGPPRRKGIEIAAIDSIMVDEGIEGGVKGYYLQGNNWVTFFPEEQADTFARYVLFKDKEATDAQ